jgi:hypothetical protein
MTEPQEVAALESHEAPDSGVSQASIKYIGQWRGLVSTTNWEKGKIISKWRQDLVDAGAVAADYSDEAWSQLVGDVTPQHVGRLRRVHDRFHDNWNSYEGLYWTHFLAAHDWEDAEMWLEGALQNHWSVAKMRNHRWETLGRVPAEEPLESQIVAEEADVDPAFDDGSPSDLIVEDVANVHSADDSTTAARPSAPKDKSSRTPGDAAVELGAGGEFGAGGSTASAPEPLQSLDDFPEDFVDAFADFRQVILKHKQAGWLEISCDAVLQSLESLRLVVVED